MDDDTRRRCLKLLYDQGERGTGLGLAMVYGMTAPTAQKLDIESTVGAGTDRAPELSVYTCPT